VLVPSGPSGYALTVYRCCSPNIPAQDTLILDLLDGKGRRLDSLRVSVSNRLTGLFEQSADFDLAFWNRPARDGALAEVRLRSGYENDLNGNFSHSVYHSRGSRRYVIAWSDALIPEGEAVRSLCRFGVREGRLHVLFPAPPR
jgi:hypothetical protein